MTLGRLAWRTPTGAILWEIWGRHRWNFLWHPVALLAAAISVQWVKHGASETVTRLLQMIATTSFIASFLALMAWFGFMEIDAQKFQFGFPSRLMLKPASAARLTLTPMLAGAAAVLVQLFTWNSLVLQPLVHFPASQTFYLVAIILSFFWWTQAAAWCFPFPEGQVLLLLAVGVAHLIAWSLPQMAGPISTVWPWPIVTVLLLSSIPVALAGQKWTRCGTWIGPSRFSRSRNAASNRRLRPRFPSPFQAQFWFEWRRYGWALPGLVAAIDFAILPFVKWMMAQQGQTEDFHLAAPAILLVAPVIISGVFGIGVGDFDLTQPSGGLPVYIAARPMTNGGFVLAKLAMALAASLLTSLITLAAALFWMTGKNGPLSATTSTPWQIALDSVPLLLLLTIFIWRNLLGGMDARLTGRTWVSGALISWGVILSSSFVGLALAAKANPNLKQWLLDWAPLALLAWLTLRIVTASIAVSYGLRRNALTRAVATWLIAGWLVCGALAAGYAWLICLTLARPVPWLWIIPAVFLIFPISDLAIAPLALTWNRHR